MVDFSQLLLDSLREASLLVGGVSGAKVFDRRLLADVNPEALLNFDQKLGHLYEDALTVLLDASESVELLASNLQIINQQKQTLGELDYVLVDKRSEQAIHLELAVKFYLAVEVEGQWQFPGPDPRDNWQRKLDRMRSHQLRLSQTPEARAVLKERFGIDSIEVRQLVYGCLFYPMSAVECPQPEGVAVDCSKGRWLYVSEWEAAFPGVETVQLIARPRWSVEIIDEVRKGLETVAVGELMQSAQIRCVMFVFEDSDMRWFLVPDGWRPGAS